MKNAPISIGIVLSLRAVLLDPRKLMIFQHNAIKIITSSDISFRTLQRGVN